MRKILAVLASAVFLVVAPGTVGGVVPWIISRRGTAAILTWPLRGIGVALIAAAVLVLLELFARFALKGLGTPAPVFPTRGLVKTALYRYVRNPMYVAVVAAVFGQSLWFGSITVLGYAALLWLGFHLFVVTYEEPTLRRKYGAEYERFCSEIPRWIPRLKRD